MELNLPRSSFYIHRIRDGLNGDSTPFDCNKLFEQVQKDMNDQEKEPCIIIGMAGTEGGLDDKVWPLLQTLATMELLMQSVFIWIFKWLLNYIQIESILHIAGKFQIWCHIEGDNLPCLGSKAIPARLAPVMAANSITFVSFKNINFNFLTLYPH